MQPHVNLQATLRSEQTAADMTAESLLARVNLHVRVQRALDRETLVAVVALERPFACMRANMPGEVTRFTESLRAELAFVRVFSLFFLLRVLLECRMSLHKTADSHKLTQKFISTHIHAIHDFPLGNCVQQDLFRHRRVRVYSDIERRY